MDLRKVHGVGPKSIDKVLELYRSGKLVRLEALKTNPRECAVRSHPPEALTLAGLVRLTPTHRTRRCAT